MNLSIHPRVVGGSTRYAKVNTAKRAKPGSKDKTIQNVEDHIAQHPNDNMSKEFLRKLKSYA